MQGVLERLASLDWSGSKGGAGKGKRPNNATAKNNLQRSSGQSPPSTQPRAAAGCPSASAAAAATTQPAGGASSTTSTTTGSSRRALDLNLAPPSLFQPGQESGILREGDLEQIDAFLPEVYQGYTWGLLYSLQQHGASFSTFYRRSKGKLPTVLVVRTTTNEVFGGFTTTSWAVTMTALGPSYYGTGESFLFKLPVRGDEDSRIQQEEEGREHQQQQQQQQQQQHQPHGHCRRSVGRAALAGIEVFPWSRENNFNMLSTETSLAMGGGGGEYGLYLSENFEAGVSGACETFHNPPLSAAGRHFDVLDVELWTLEQPVLFLAREQQLSERRAAGGGLHRRSLSLDPRYGTAHAVDSPYSSVYQSFDDGRRSPEGHAGANAGTWPRHVARSRSMGAPLIGSSNEWL